MGEAFDTVTSPFLAFRHSPALPMAMAGPTWGRYLMLSDPQRKLAVLRSCHGQPQKLKCRPGVGRSGRSPARILAPCTAGSELGPFPHSFPSLVPSDVRPACQSAGTTKSLV